MLKSSGFEFSERAGQGGGREFFKAEIRKDKKEKVRDKVEGKHKGGGLT